jgi:hypothetical protein
MKIIGLSFDSYLNCAGRWFSCSRIYIKGKWSPFVRVELRKNAKWFGLDDKDIK